ncbi:MAG: alpha/beta hydrolase [Saprospiraceae bacterium]|nr:alpha/beta hydrolase [Lewinella sp.]
MLYQSLKFNKYLLIGALYMLNASLWAQVNELPAQTDWFLSTGDWQSDPQLYIREWGSGPDTVIVLHGGWGGEYSGMMEAVAGLENQYHFISYDQRGSLRSPFPDSLITFQQHINDLELLRRELALDQVTILAHSMGGVLGAAYAAQYPQRIRKLILVTPAYLKNPIPDADEERFGRAQQQFQVFLNRPEVEQELQKYDLLRTSSPLSSREETAKFRIPFAARMLYDVTKWKDLTGGRAIYQGKVFGLTADTYPAEGWDYPATFARHSLPVTVIACDHDFLDFGNTLIRTWLEDVPSVRIMYIERAGHIPWIDRPERFHEALLNALSH